jgi:hypothetical protein
MTILIEDLMPETLPIASSCDCEECETFRDEAARLLNAEEDARWQRLEDQSNPDYYEAPSERTWMDDENDYMDHQR